MTESYTFTREHLRTSLVAAFLNGWWSHVNGEPAPLPERYADQVLDAMHLRGNWTVPAASAAQEEG